MVIKLCNWWFRETCKLPHGFIMFLAYITIVRAIILRFFNVDYFMLDGIVFSIFISLTMCLPMLKEEQLRSKE